jgi:hypothetical protein
MTKAKICMYQIKCISFILFTTVLALVIQLLIINPAMAQGPNTTSAEIRNNTRVFVSVKNHTISFTLVDAKTNETISVKNFPIKEAANTTTNENLTKNTENATTNEILTPENTTTNETLTKNTENATTNENLTAKFNELQNK